MIPIPYLELERPGKHVTHNECERTCSIFWAKGPTPPLLLVSPRAENPDLGSTNGSDFLVMLLPKTGPVATPPTKEPSAKDLENMEVAIQQARLGLKEGGIPIGGALVSRAQSLKPKLVSISFDRVRSVLWRRKIAGNRKK